jgi:hypothetical protein
MTAEHRRDPESEYLAQVHEPGVDTLTGEFLSPGALQTAAAAFKAASRDPRLLRVTPDVESLARTTAVYQD